jgi:hypothetical protein
VPRYENSLRKRVTRLLTEQGFEVFNEWRFFTIRPDIRAIKCDSDDMIVDELIVELKGGNAGTHEIISGVGQLLYYNYLIPTARLALAIPAKCNRPLTHELIEFLADYHIELLKL